MKSREIDLPATLAASPEIPSYKIVNEDVVLFAAT
jgi:hypothetical protein